MSAGAEEVPAPENHCCTDQVLQAIQYGVARARDNHPGYTKPINASLHLGHVRIEAFTGEQKVFAQFPLRAGTQPQDLEQAIYQKADTLIARIVGE